MILSKENIQHVAASAVSLPTAGLFELPEKVLQFGTGVLLRGLPDYFIDKANRAGVFNGRVVVVKSTNKGDLRDFSRQDNLYTLCVRGLEQGQAVEENIISSAISRVIAADADWSSILDLALSKDLQVIISNTTEVGLSLVEESIAQNPPVSFPAKLVAILYRRYEMLKDEAGHLVVIPTELIPDNGAKLKTIVREIAAYNQLGDAFNAWLDVHVTFCNSLVDRIVPGKPAGQEFADLTAKLGYEDQLLAMVEPYRLWAIEGDESLASILSFSQVDPGVVITSDIEKYRELKVRLLNGTHTLSCGIAVLSGIDTVKNGMNEPTLYQYIKTVMQEDIIPAIPYEVDEQEAFAFSNIVLDRFANPYIAHLWLGITVQYTMKMKIRVFPLLQEHYALYLETPAHLAFGFASYLMFMRSQEKDGKYYGQYRGLEYLIQDDQAAHFASAYAAHPGDAGYFEQVFDDSTFWGTDLNDFPGFKDAVRLHYTNILEKGIESALSDFNQHYTTPTS
ncbi:tagaturonate reductase [Pedobacter sp.]|uniref:tagaturonate reductase n=1 Tax=Pedobacter sp. TaxID=1411316 RepID=UPI003D7FB12D